MPRLILLFVTLGLLMGAQTAPALAASHALSPAQQKAVEQMIHDYLLNRPEVVLEGVRNLQQRQEGEAQSRAKASLAELKKQIEDDPASPVGGNPHGDVTVVEFFDYACGYCKKAYPDLKTLIGGDKNIRLVYKEFPILGPASDQAARVAMAVWRLAPGKYAAFHDAVMGGRGQPTEKGVLRTAGDLGLDSERVRLEAASPMVTQAIEGVHALARQLNISGTPAFIIGGELVPGAIDLETMKKLVKRARAKG